MCRFSSGNWCFCTKFVELAVAGKRRNTVVDLQKRVINCTWLRVSIFDWSIIKIGPDGLVIVVPMYMQFQLQFYWWGCRKKNSQTQTFNFIIQSDIPSTVGDALIGECSDLKNISTSSFQNQKNKLFFLFFFSNSLHF